MYIYQAGNYVTEITATRSNSSYTHAYYYDTAADFEIEKFAGRFLHLLSEEMKLKKKNNNP